MKTHTVRPLYRCACSYSYLVRELTILDVLGAEPHGSKQCLWAVQYAVVALIACTQTLFRCGYTYFCVCVCAFLRASDVGWSEASRLNDEWCGGAHNVHPNTAAMMCMCMYNRVCVCVCVCVRESNKCECVCVCLCNKCEYAYML